MLKSAWFLAICLISTAFVSVGSASAAGSCVRLDLSVGECETRAVAPPQHRPEQPAQHAAGSGCHFEGKSLPCRELGGHWLGSRKCYLVKVPAFKPNDPTRATWAAEQAKHPGKSAYSCHQVLSVENGRAILLDPGVAVPERLWLSTAQAVDPETAARTVIARMNLVAPELGLSPKLSGPDGTAYVNVPVWMWAANRRQSTTGPQRIRQAQDGLVVTIDATVDRMTWSMGDGSTVTCDTPGTPYHRSYGVDDSPDCGYRYKTPSDDEPHCRRTVSATTHWTIHWTAAGQQGTVPLDLIRTTTLPVGELRPVLVDPNGTGDYKPTPHPCQQ